MSKKLFLVRHAAAEWQAPGQLDKERTLTDVGEEQAASVGKQLEAKKVYPQLLLASPATRAQATARLIATEIGFAHKNIHFDSQIYEADLNQLTAVIDNIDDKFDEVMLVGHNPGLSWLANFLCEGEKVSLSTGQVCALEFEIKNWQALFESSGKRLWVLNP